MPIYVELVENEKDLGEETARGGGGFGSSGR
jgi:dUTPase